MRLILEALLLLSFASQLHAKTKQMKPMKYGTKSKGAKVKLILEESHLRSIPNSFSNIANMSLSPWIYKDSYNPSRLPERISQAHCLTSGCVSPHLGLEDSTLEVKPIQYQVLVVYRDDSSKKKNKKGNNLRKFRLGTEVVTVGCTCVRPTVIPQH